MKTNYWEIEGLNNEYETLADAKSHFSQYTTNEVRNNEIPEQILHIVNDEVYSVVRVEPKLIKDKWEICFSRVEINDPYHIDKEKK